MVVFPKSPFSVSASLICAKVATTSTLCAWSSMSFFSKSDSRKMLSCGSFWCFRFQTGSLTSFAVLLSSRSEAAGQFPTAWSSMSRPNPEPVTEAFFERGASCRKVTSLVEMSMPLATIFIWARYFPAGRSGSSMVWIFIEPSTPARVHCSRWTCWLSALVTVRSTS